LLGGYLGDHAAIKWPDHGRIFVVQISVATGPIFSLWLFKVRVDPRQPTALCHVSFEMRNHRITYSFDIGMLIVPCQLAMN